MAHVWPAGGSLYSAPLLPNVNKRPLRAREGHGIEGRKAGRKRTKGEIRIIPLPPIGIPGSATVTAMLDAPTWAERVEIQEDCEVAQGPASAPPCPAPVRAVFDGLRPCSVGYIE